MAVDKLVDSAQLNSDLTSVANAIRTKGGTSAQLAFPADFVSAIEDISTGTQLSIIGSGSFTTASEGLIDSIPVSYDGDPVLVYVKVDSPLEGVSTQPISVLCYMGAIPQDITDFSNGLGVFHVLAAGTNSYINNAGAALPITLTENTLTIKNPSATNKWKANNYHYYIYG